MLIPRVFHQIWLGSEPFPDEFVPYRQSWLEHHPGWELKLWTEDNLPGDLRRPEARELLRNPAERSDILRYELLWRLGGVYVDTDFECLRSIEPLIHASDVFAGYFKPGRVNNALIGSIAGHPFAERALGEIRPRTTWGTLDKDLTGPPFLARVLAEFPDVELFDPSVFYPRTERQREQAYAVHHRARSWKDEEGLRASLKKTEQRLRSSQEDARTWRLRSEKAEAELISLRGRSGPRSPLAVALSRGIRATPPKENPNRRIAAATLLWAAASALLMVVGALGPWASVLGVRVDGIQDEIVLVLATIAIAALIVSAQWRRQLLLLAPLCAGLATAILATRDAVDGDQIASGVNQHLVRIDWGLYVVVVSSISLVLASTALVIGPRLFGGGVREQT